MSVIGGAVRGVSQAVNRAANATTAAAGAVGGAAVNGVIGGVTGAAEGVKRGMNSGSHSTPAAALAIGALGVAGLVEWPLLLAVGGGALLLQRLNRKSETEPRAVKANLKSVPVESARSQLPRRRLPQQRKPRPPRPPPSRRPRNRPDAGRAPRGCAAPTKRTRRSADRPADHRRGHGAATSSAAGRSCLVGGRIRADRAPNRPAGAFAPRRGVRSLCRISTTPTRHNSA